MAISIKKLTPVNTEERKALAIKAGDTIRVWSKIKEEKISTKANKKTEKTIKFRLQAFEGIVLARKHGKEAGATITIRKVSSGIGVERIFPLYSPLIDKVEIIKKAKTRRSKLYYIREKAAKEAKRKMKATVVSQGGNKDIIEEDEIPEAEEKAIEIIGKEEVEE
ncbi:MAG: 50S ribosomal protein L19 [Candidatus Paceibacterota bacterium]|jgi:large subunit ribosomal protein L19